jgi:phosphoglycolate phosphatase-like HAD superfamily hydrolase
VLEFLRGAAEVAPPDRIAIFDNDGTLWCEKPTYPQVYFFVDELRAATTARPELATRPEYRAVLRGDRAALREFGLERVAMALVELFEGMHPEAFTDRVERFFATAEHPERKVAFGDLVYVPMLELIEQLRSLDFRVFIATAGGADFVRAVSERIYGVAPEQVIGSRVTYEVRRDDGELSLRRTARLDGDPNEGPAKLPSIQRQIGRRPILAGGNSPGDAELLEYAGSGKAPTLALLIDHDDEDREYAYQGVAGSFDAEEPILTTAERLGWTVVSMRRDWTTVFGS